MIYMMVFSWYEQISAWLKMFHDVFHICEQLTNCVYCVHLGYDTSFVSIAEEPAAFIFRV